MDGHTVTSAPASKLRSNPRPLRLLYTCAALLIGLLLATNAALILHLRETRLISEERHLKSLSLTLAEQADRSFQSVDLMLSSLADYITDHGAVDRTSLHREMARHDIHLLLNEKISGIPQIDAVTVIDADGNLVNFSRYWPIPEVNVSDRDYFQALKADETQKTFISAPVLNRGNGTWTIFLAHRLNGSDGAFLGLVLGAMELKYFEDFYRAVSPADQSTIVLVRQDGMMLARYPAAADIGKAFGAERILQGGISGTVRELSPIDGLLRLKAARALAKYPLFVIATQTEEAALKDWWGITRLMSLGALGCALSIAVAAVAVGRQWKQQAILANAQAKIRRHADRTAAFEAMRTAKETAEAADRAKSAFLATMSHELRTPLNAVLGFSELMLKEVFGPLGNDRYRIYAHDIHSSGSHLLSIINDVLDLSKAASGKLELIEDWIDAREIVDSVCRLIQPRIDQAKLSLTVKMPPSGLITHADERLLKQMLLNLLSNACKFTPPNGRIECSVSVDATGITFAVTDTGIGISAEHLDLVLQPFVQVDGSLSRRHEGTGLGLALVKAMAELHGGTLRLASEVGSGTTAAVILPFSRLNPARTDIAPEMRHPPGAQRAIA
jgi:signal transduction histidine kinase